MSSRKFKVGDFCVAYTEDRKNYFTFYKTYFIVERVNEYGEFEELWASYWYDIAKKGDATGTIIKTDVQSCVYASKSRRVNLKDKKNKKIRDILLANLL